MCRKCALSGAPGGDEMGQGASVPKGLTVEQKTKGAKQTKVAKHKKPAEEREFSS